MFSITVPIEPLLMYAGQSALSGMETITIDGNILESIPVIDLTANADLSGFSLGSIPDVACGEGYKINYESTGYCTFPFSFTDVSVICDGLVNILQYLQEESDLPTTTPDSRAAISRAQSRFRDLLDRLSAYFAERNIPL